MDWKREFFGVRFLKRVILFFFFFVGGCLVHLLCNEMQRERLGGPLSRLSIDETVENMEDGPYSPFAVPSCAGLVPTYNTTYALHQGEFTRLVDLRAPGHRVMLVAARFGIGNSLRGYCSSYVYSILSGRKIVLLHAGPHGRILDLFCAGLECALESIPGGRFGNKSSMWKDLRSYRPLHVLSTTRNIPLTLFDENPIAFSQSASFYDNYWLRNATLRRCVLDTFRCRNKWCVQSRAMRALVRGPSQELAAIIDKTIVSSATPSSSATKLPSKFDFAIHVRTRSPTVEDPEYFNLNLDSCNTTTCRKKLKKVDEVHARYTGFALWNCVGEEILRHNAERKGSLSIFLATDNQVLRPFFIEKLKQYGVVYYSSGSAVHSSKSNKSISELLPTIAELYLMSRGETLIEAEAYISTFSYVAGLIGNNTIAAVKLHGSECRFHYENRKRSP